MSAIDGLATQLKSQQQQILVCYGSTQNQGIGVAQDPLLVKWSNQGDYTNFTPAATNQARFVTDSGPGGGDR